MKINLLKSAAVSVFLILCVIGCANKEIETVSIYKMLQTPLGYTGRQVKVRVRITALKSQSFDFFAEDLIPSVNNQPLQIPVRYKGDLPPDDTEIDMYGKIMMVGADYMFFADSIDYSDDADLQ
jgi:hypothetical protein